MQFSLPALADITDPIMLKAIKAPLQDIIINGSPGTGKTVVAVYKLIHLLSEGKKCLFLCFNKPLKELVSVNANKYKEFIKTADGLYYPYKKDKDNDWIKGQSKDTLVAAWKEHIEKYGKYDMIIVDEAQDMTRDILESLDVLTDHLTLCLDENQILDADVSSKIPYVDMDIIKDIYPDIRPIELTRNYRNTKEIYEFAATKFMSKNEVANNPILTRNVRSDKDSTPVFIDGKIDLMSQVDTICDILNKTPDSHTIGILVPDMNTRDSISIELEKRGVIHKNYGKKDTPRDEIFFDRIMLFTFKTSKGLEFDTVISLVIHEKMKNEQRKNETLFVVSSRAKQRLYFIFNT